MSEIIDNLKLGIVNKSLSGTKVDLFNQTIQKTTNPMNLNYCQTDDTYSVLTQGKLTEQIPDYNENIIPKKTRIHIYLNDKISKIVLNDFPIGQYILCINGHNVTTAKREGSNYIFDFNFKVSKNKRTKLLKNGIISDDDYFKLLKSATIGDDSDNDYFNFACIDQVRILCNVGFKYNTTKEITLHGYFDGDVLSTKTVYVYPNEGNNLHMHLSYPTESLDFYFDMNRTKHNAKLMLFINGEEYEIIDVDNSLPFQRIKLKYLKEKYLGKQNKHLTDEINKNTLNLSKIDDISVVTTNTKINSITQNYYKTFAYPSRCILFVDGLG